MIIVPEYIVDRIEGNYVICETEQGNFLKVERNQLPPNVSEGDVLQEEDGAFQIDQQKTKQRKQKIFNLSKSVFKNPKKD